MANVAAVPESPFAAPARTKRALLWLRPASAGRIPRQKFHGLQHAWRKQVWLYAAGGALLPVAFFAAFSAFLNPPDPQFFWGFCVGAGCAVFASCMYLAVPDRIDNWRRGAEGERRTARKLSRLERRGWIAVHSTPTAHGDRDHILLGPGGIFVLDSKVRRGELSVNDAGELVIDHGEDAPATRPEPLAKRAAASLATSISQQTRYRPYVRAVVVLWGDFPDRRAERAGVTFVHGDDLVDWIETARVVPLIPSWEADVVEAVARFVQPAHQHG